MVRGDRASKPGVESEKFSFISRQRLENRDESEGEEEVRFLARGVKRGKSFSRDFICDGGAICSAGNLRLCSNGMGFIRCSAMATFFS